MKNILTCLIEFNNKVRRDTNLPQSRQLKDGIFLCLDRYKDSPAAYKIGIV